MSAFHTVQVPHFQHLKCCKNDPSHEKKFFFFMFSSKITLKKPFAQGVSTPQFFFSLFSLEGLASSSW